jgi:integrase
LNEAINLYWDRSDRIRITINESVPTLHIPGELQKNGTDQICPIAPEFFQLLEQVPQPERNGQVFKLGMFKRIRTQDWKEKSSKVISNIGRKAGIVVATDVRTGKQKFASAHDLRRSFGERWSTRVLPQVLKELMRHESITTTMDYYVGRNAEKLYAVLQAAMPN